jgi:hypothetical protein
MSDTRAADDPERRVDRIFSEPLDDENDAEDDDYQVVVEKGRSGS